MARADDLDNIMRALSAPLGDLIASVGRGVAEAQQALDLNTLATFREVHSSDSETYEELRKLGYQPTWYRIPEVTADISVALSATGNERGRVTQSGTGQPVEGAGALSLRATPIDATFTNSYDYNARASSRLSFKVVAVPPTAEAEDLKVLPDLVNGQVNVRDAEAILSERGIPYRFNDPYYEPQDNDRIVKTDPPPGAFISGTNGVILYLENYPNEIAEMPDPDTEQESD